MLGTKLWECGFFVGSWICRCSIGTGISEPRIPRGLLGVFSRVATPRLGVERGGKRAVLQFWRLECGLFFLVSVPLGGLSAVAEKKTKLFASHGLLVSKSDMSPLHPLACCSSTNQVTSSSRTLIALAAFMPSTRFKGGPGAITHHRIMSSSPHPPTLPSSLGCLSAGLGRCRVPADSGSLCRVQFCNTAWLERTGQMTPKTAFM